MCFEQPDRERSAIAALGAAVALEDRGEGRFERVAARWRQLLARARADAVSGPPGSGLVACGGFAFAHDGGGAHHWAAFAPASLVVGEVTLARWGEEVWCTVAVATRADDDPDELLERAQARLEGIESRPLALLDPHPTARHTISGAMAPEHYEAAVARAVELIAAGRLEKIVLAREVDVHAPAAHDVAAVYGVLREAFGGCFVYAAGRGNAAFIGATPEVLLRRSGLRVSTVALAGSIGRSADPSVDDHLGERLLRSEKDREEHAIVARQIERTLRPHAVWVTMPDEPEVVRVANIQHLATRDPGAARGAGLRRRARRHAAPDSRRRRVAEGRRPSADPRARGDRPRLVCRNARMDGLERGRRVLRRPALCARRGRDRALLCGRRDRGRLRPGAGARRDRGQARGAPTRIDVRRCASASSRARSVRTWMRPVAPSAVRSSSSVEGLA